MKKYILILLTLLCSLGAAAQSRSVALKIHVSTEMDDPLEGQPIHLEQTDFSVSYGNLALDADGNCNVKVYPGNHRLTVERHGYDSAVKDFNIADGCSTASVEIALSEKTSKPFALQASVSHNPYNGYNELDLSWNIEPPVFSDDFESYDPFAITFGGWTGIDADGEATAALLGTYPNRGTMQYAQIINPLTVVPTWWYDYPILRPYEGKQYLGFIRTESGRANDDWLISPAITPGTDNVLQFMAKAADRWPERFMVYVTTKTDSPTVDDFERIDRGNYESVDYRGWTKCSYDLSAYAGQQIKFAIRYVGDANRYGAFMLMVDNVYVGPEPLDMEPEPAKARRVMRSPANPNETFDIFVDGTKIANVSDYRCYYDNIGGGRHTIGVQAVYRQARSEMAEIEVDVPDGPFARVTLNVEANSIISPDRVEMTMLNLDDGQQLSFAIVDGHEVLASLPYGRYSVHIGEGLYEEYSAEVEIDKDTTLKITLEDNPVAPFNVTADVDPETGKALLRWNRDLGFSDSFETYDDFATGRFGDWIGIDRDQAPVYPIALGNASNIVSFPGSGSATNPTAIGPMVFNPWMTTPAMLPTDPAIEAPDGQKTVIFFSPQRVQADKWLISPLLEVRDGYQLRFKAKAYTSMYAETLEILISDGSTNPDDFTELSYINPLASEAWVQYSLDLSEFAGTDVRIAIRYISFDAFLAQLDCFELGKPEGEDNYTVYDNIMGYDIYIDGAKAGESEVPEFEVSGLTPGSHTAGIVARYLTRTSPVTEYTFGVTSGINAVEADAAADAPAEIYDLSGRRLNSGNAPGFYIIRRGDKVSKYRK